MIARDVRSAGYDVDADATPTPQPPIAYIDSLELIISENLVPYPDNATPQPPLAYDPVGAPRPPPARRRGVAADDEVPVGRRAGALHARSQQRRGRRPSRSRHPRPAAPTHAGPRNPNDYVLAREVFGDSTGNVAGNNGGSTEAGRDREPSPVGPCRRSTRVYMRGLSTPWDWSTGPVPAARLGRHRGASKCACRRPSTKPDWRGNYANTELRTSVSTMRNSPEIGPPTHLVDGYIYEDANHNGNKDGGEAGWAAPTCGSAVSTRPYSASNGYFNFRVPSGSYSCVTRLPPDMACGPIPTASSSTWRSTTITRSFGDTARAGSFVAIHTFNDLNANGVRTRASRRSARCG